MKRWSIRTKISAMILATLATTFIAGALVNSIAFASRYNEVLRTESRIGAQHLHLQLEQLLRLGLTLDGIMGFEEQCQEIVARYDSIAYALVANAEGMIVFHSDPSQQGQSVADPDQIGTLTASADPITRRQQIAGTAYLETTMPVYDETGNLIGAIRVGVPEHLIVTGTINVMLTTIITNIVLLSLATIGLFVFMHRSITLPLTRLVSFIERIRRQQDLTERISVTSTDEIGQLSTAFNEMLGDLKQSRQELQAHANDLEHEIAERKRTEEERTKLQQQLIEAQSATLRELSTPLIPITDTVVIMPLIGTIDSQRAQQIMEALLDGVARQQAELVILDITGVSVVDTQIASVLIQAAQAVRLLGAQVMLTGIQPRIAQTLVQLGVDLRSIQTRSSLQDGILESLRASRPDNGKKPGDHGIRLR